MTRCIKNLKSFTYPLSLINTGLHLKKFENNICSRHNVIVILNSNWSYNNLTTTNNNCVVHDVIDIYTVNDLIQIRPSTKTVTFSENTV